MYRVGFILNGRSSNKRSFYKSLDHARQSHGNLEFNVIETSQAGHATSLASEFLKDAYTHVIAVGGDGTLHETLNGFLKNEHKEAILGSLPSGTANDFLKTTESPTDVTSLFEAILNDHHEAIDIGHIHHSGGSEYFINIADLGIGAEVVKRVNSSRKLLGAHMTYFSAIAKTFATYKNRHVVCEADNWKYDGLVNSLVIGNGRFFGNGMCIAPEASIYDGTFQVIVIGNITIRDYLRHLNQIKRGELIEHPEVHYYEATHLKIDGDIACGIEADGELIGKVPAEISIVPGKIRFLTGRRRP